MSVIRQLQFSAFHCNKALIAVCIVRFETKCNNSGTIYYYSDYYYYNILVINKICNTICNKYNKRDKLKYNAIIKITIHNSTLLTNYYLFH